jgi:hypothetical protein
MFESKYLLTIIPKKNKYFSITVTNDTDSLNVTINFRTFLLLQKLIFCYLRLDKYKTKNLKFKSEHLYPLKEGTYLRFVELINFLKTEPKEDAIQIYCKDSFTP